MNDAAASIRLKNNNDTDGDNPNGLVGRRLVTTTTTTSSSTTTVASTTTNENPSRSRRCKSDRDQGLTRPPLNNAHAVAAVVHHPSTRSSTPSLSFSAAAAAASSAIMIAAPLASSALRATAASLKRPPPPPPPTTTTAATRSSSQISLLDPKLSRGREEGEALYHIHQTSRNRHMTGESSRKKRKLGDCRNLPCCSDGDSKLYPEAIPSTESAAATSVPEPGGSPGPRAVASLALTSQIIVWGQEQRDVNAQLRRENQLLQQRLKDLERRVNAIERRQRDVLDVRQQQLQQQNEQNRQLLNRVLDLLRDRNINVAGIDDDDDDHGNGDDGADANADANAAPRVAAEEQNNAHNGEQGNDDEGDVLGEEQGDVGLRRRAAAIVDDEWQALRQPGQRVVRSIRLREGNNDIPLRHDAGEAAAEANAIAGAAVTHRRVLRPRRGSRVLTEQMRH